jgi:WD40 repeat protein
LKGHAGAVASVCFSPDGKHALSGSETVKLWNAITGDCIRTFGEDSDRIKSVCFSPGGKHVFSGGPTGATAKMWDIATGDCIRSFEKYETRFAPLCLSPNGRRLIASGAYDYPFGTRDVEVWDVEAGKHIKIIEGVYLEDFSSACFSPDGRKIFLGGDKKSVKVFDVESGIWFCSFDEIGSKVHKISISPDGQTFAAATQTKIYLYALDFDLLFPGWYNLINENWRIIPDVPDTSVLGWYYWVESVNPYLDIFLALHPDWTDDDFNNILIPDLQNRGYGWLRPEGVRAKLEKMYGMKQK